MDAEDKGAVNASASSPRAMLVSVPSILNYRGDLREFLKSWPAKQKR